MSNDTAKSVRNIVAQFPVLKGTNKLMMFVQGLLLKPYVKYNVQER